MNKHKPISGNSGVVAISLLNNWYGRHDIYAGPSEHEIIKDLGSLCENYYDLNSRKSISTEDIKHIPLFHTASERIKEYHVNSYYIETEENAIKHQN